MKIRQGFVSNSSSSSFVILKDNLTPEMISHIENHIEYAKENFHQFSYADEDDSWSVNEKGRTIELYTYLDNFDMHEFLILLGVPEDDIVYSG